MAAEVSVVVPTFRRRDSVERLLLALCRQSAPAHDFEVVVSIDGSEDGTHELVESFDAPFALRAVWQPNGGRASACNAGIRASNGTVVVLLDDDMVPSARFVAAHREAHRCATPRLVIGAVPIAHDDASPPLRRFIARKFDAHLERLARPGHEFGVRDVYTGNASILREVIERVGLFDEAFRVYGNEDLELAFRLRRAGVDIAFSPDAIAQQFYEKDFAGLARDTEAKARTAVEFAAKHPDVFPSLELAHGRDASRQWRAARGALVRASVAVPGTRRIVIALTYLLERTNGRHLDLWYRFTLDYFYWLGATESLRDASAHHPLQAVP